MKAIRWVIVGLVSGAFCASGDDWPQFRGPDRNGIAEGAKPPLHWSDTENIAWKTPIPGLGHSSPVVQGSNVYLTTALAENVRRDKIGNNPGFYADRITLLALCLDRETGRIHWQKELLKVDKPDPVHTLNSFATPTPVVDDKHLYCDFGAYGTVCVRRDDGAVAWKVRLPVDHEVGPGSSALLYGNLLILLRDGCDVQYIAALDRTTGAEVWKTMRPPLTGTQKSHHKSFSTPIVFESNGRTQLVASCAQWLVSYDPVTGKEHWRVRHGEGFSLAAQPSESNGMVYFSTGFSGTRMMAVRHDGQGDVSGTHVVWQSSQFAPIIPSPIVRKDRIYWIKDSGPLCCVNAATGDLVWKRTLNGNYYASPILAANRIYLVGHTGMTTVVEPGDEFKELAVNQLSDVEILATPAFVDNSVFLRSDKHLYCIRQD